MPFAQRRVPHRHEDRVCVFGKARRRLRARLRPALEGLEDRRLLAAFAVTVATDTDTVTGDPGSLRAAILASNAAPGGTNSITFNIPGAGARTITLGADLPAITVPVVINGYTQPGASPNTKAVGDDATLLIQIDGTNADVGLDIVAGATTVKGLVINRVQGNAIELRKKGGDVIAGNFLGTDASGTSSTIAVGGNQNVAAANLGSGVSILDPSADTVGGSAAADRNIISNNQGNGVSIDQNDMFTKGNAGAAAPANNLVQNNYIGPGASGTKVPNPLGVGNKVDGIRIARSAGNTIVGNVISGNGSSGLEISFLGTNNNTLQGNLIGTDASGTSALGNINGIFIQNGVTKTLIGGPTAGQGNVISGNSGAGIILTGTDTLNNAPFPTQQNTIQGNDIGVALDGHSPLANGGIGVSIGAISNTVGGTGAGAGNVIAFNKGEGVVITDVDDPSTGNAILSNSIYSNTTLGIDLKAPPPTGPGPNNLQPAPALQSAFTANGSTTVQGTLKAAASTAFTLQFFATTALAAPTRSEGKTLLGTTTVTTDANGNATIAATLNATLTAGGFVTATATDPKGNTSEFSQSVVGDTGTLIVDNRANPDPNTDFTTIPAAVAAARPGDTISVRSGTYTGTVLVDRSLTILGARFGIAGETQAPGSPDPTILTGGANGGFLLTADNTTIGGFTVSNNAGLGVTTTSQTSGDHILYNVFLGNAGGADLASNGQSPTLVLNNTFDTNNAAGGGGGIGLLAGRGLSNAFLTSNTFTGQSRASMFLIGAVAPATKLDVESNTFTKDAPLILFSVTNSQFFYNQITGSSGTGIFALGNVTGVFIVANTITGNVGDGVALIAFGGSPITGNSVTANTITGNAGSGIRLLGATGNVVALDQLSGNAGFGIVADGTASRNIIIQNTFSGNVILDALDLSTGTLTKRTANFWFQNKGSRAYPLNLLS